MTERLGLSTLSYPSSSLPSPSSSKGDTSSASHAPKDDASSKERVFVKVDNSKAAKAPSTQAVAAAGDDSTLNSGLARVKIHRTGSIDLQMMEDGDAAVAVDSPKTKAKNEFISAFQNAKKKQSKEVETSAVATQERLQLTAQLQKEVGSCVFWQKKNVAFTNLTRACKSTEAAWIADPLPPRRERCRSRRA